MSGKRLTDEDKDLLRSMRAEGLTYRQIAEKTGHSLPTVERYCNPNSAVARYCSTEASNRWRENHPMQALMNRLRAAAIRRGAVFTLTLETLPPLTCCCPKCGVAYEADPNHVSRRSLDKIIPALGYVPGNVMWLCANCNRQKSDMTVDDFRSWVVFLDELAA